MGNPLWLILGGFAVMMGGVLIGYQLGRMHAEAAAEEAPPASPPQKPARRPAAPATTAAFEKKWPNPPTRVIEVPSRVIEAMSKETGALDLDGDGNVALKISTSTRDGRTRYTLLNEEEGVTHEYDHLDDIPPAWRPLVDRFLATQREIFGGTPQMPRRPRP